jgi:hypothetical protein
MKSKFTLKLLLRFMFLILMIRACFLMDFQQKKISHVSLYADVSGSMGCTVNGRTLFSKSLEVIPVITQFIREQKRSWTVSLNFFSSFIFEVIPATRDLDYMENSLSILARTKLVGPSPLADTLVAIEKEIAREPQKIVVLLTDGFSGQALPALAAWKLQRRLLILRIENPCAGGKSKQSLLSAGPFSAAEIRAVQISLAEMMAEQQNSHTSYPLLLLLIYYCLEFFIENKLAQR